MNEAHQNDTQVIDVREVSDLGTVANPRRVRL
jgi:hypothetical protein